MNNGVEMNQNNVGTVPTTNTDINGNLPVSSELPNNLDTIVVPSGMTESDNITASLNPVYQNAPGVSETVSVVSPSDVSMVVNSNVALNTSEDVESSDDNTSKKKKKSKKKDKKSKQDESSKASENKKSFFPFFLVLLLLGLGIFTYYSYTSSQRVIDELKYMCTPVNETREEVFLPLDSTLVKDLYSKVSTSIREDVAQPEWNDTMKVYLAFRQVPEYKMYDSHCNMFQNSKMEPYTCEMSVNFMPKAFLTSTLELEWKKLFGDETPMPRINVKLTNSCVGGYEYIAERDEYVQGYCKEQTATSFKAKKTLKSAVSSRNTIVLEEDVKYSGNEKMDLPLYLKSGTYYYTFRLDMNYNYVLVSKKYDEKY